MKPRTNVYIDGFNLYYGSIKDTPYHWLNLSKLCTILLPGYHISKIRYFTALVTPAPGDPDKLQRQLTFIRALKTLPDFSIHYGQFLTHVVTRPLAIPPANGPFTVKVMDTKEKGSDVNLAAYLLMDGFKKDYQIAVIMSNDSDLAEPIRMVRNELGLDAGVIHPHKRHVKELAQVAKFYRPIREKALKVSLFPDVMRDENGTIHKPATW